MKYLIVDIEGRYAAGLDENGMFVRIPDAGYAIGETVEAKEPKHRGTVSIVKRAAVAAAAAVLTVALGAGAAYAVPYGTVSLDASCSIEYTINCYNYVIGVTAVNEEAELLLDSLDSSLKYQKIDTAIETTVEKMEEDDPSEILIAVGTHGTKHSDDLSRYLGEVMDEHTDRPVYTVPISMDDVEQGHKENTTGGRHWQQSHKPEDDGNGRQNEPPEKPEGEQNTGTGAISMRKEDNDPAVQQGGVLEPGSTNSPQPYGGRQQTAQPSSGAGTQSGAGSTAQPVASPQPPQPTPAAGTETQPPEMPEGDMSGTETAQPAPTGQEPDAAPEGGNAAPESAPPVDTSARGGSSE